MSQKLGGEFSDRNGLEDSVKCRLLGPIPRDSGSVGPGRQSICISNKLSCDADANANATGPEITLENHWSRTTLSTRSVM